MNKKIFIAAASLLFIITTVLAFLLEWHYDEALTYFSTEHADIWGIVTYKELKLANNHLFNSSWVWLVQQYNIKEPIAYRCLSLCSYIVYLVYFYKLIVLQKPKGKKNVYFLAFLFLPYAPYFAMARGYSIALAFFLMALYHYHVCFREAKAPVMGNKFISSLFLFLLAGALSSLSIITFFYPFVAMFILLGIMTYLPAFRQNKTNTRTHLCYAASCVVVTIIAFLVYRTGNIITENDPAIIGTPHLIKNGFLSSIITYLSLENNLPHHFFTALRVLMVISLAPVMLKLLRERRSYHEPSILGLTVLLLIVSHYLLGSLYPLIRGTIPLVVLLYLPITYLAMNKGNPAIKAHLALIFITGSVYFGILLSDATRKSSDDVLLYMSQANDTLLITHHHPGIELYNHLQYNDSLNIIHITDPTELAKKISTSKYILTSQPVKWLDEASFDLKYKMRESNFYVKKTH